MTRSRKDIRKCDNETFFVIDDNDYRIIKSEMLIFSHK